MTIRRSAALTFAVMALLLWPSVEQLRAGTKVNAADLPLAMMFMVYLITAFISLFFNTALAAIVLARMRGERLSLLDGLSIALNQTPSIAVLALLTAIFGMFLRLVSQWLKPAGAIVATLPGAAWGVAMFLVVPVLVAEDAGPFDAIDRSVTLIKKTWGEQVGGRLSLGAVESLLMLPSLALLFEFAVTNDPTVRVARIVGAVAYFAVMMLVTSTLEQILRAAVYYYARTGEAPAGFDTADLRDVFGADDSSSNSTTLYGEDRF